jgi:hypothetical protein
MKSLLSVMCAVMFLGAGTLISIDPVFAAKAKAPRSAKSLECSKQADAQQLHGKARKTFRNKCMRAKS